MRLDSSGIWCIMKEFKSSTEKNYTNLNTNSVGSCLKFLLLSLRVEFFLPELCFLKKFGVMPNESQNKSEKVTPCLLFASINLLEENQKHIITYEKPKIGTAYICAQKCIAFIPYHSVQYVLSLYQRSSIFVDHLRVIKIFASLQSYYRWIVYFTK